jgi:putative DNA primase/helicase
MGSRAQSRTHVLVSEMSNLIELAATFEIPDTRAFSVPEAAAEWRRLGWHPVPLRRDRRVPYVRWSRGTDLSPEATKHQFERWPGCLMAIALPRGVVVLDIDHRPEKGWDAGVALESLRDAYDLPRCPTAQTPKGGAHLWFALPDGCETRNWTSQHSRLAVAGIDIRTHGGLAIVPPSQRPDGDYSWKLWLPKLPLATPALCEALKPPPPRLLPSAPDLPPRRLPAYVAAAYASEISAVSLCSKGGRNERLFRSAAALGSFVAIDALPRDHAFESLMMAAGVCGLVRDDGQRAVAATIASGFKAGLASPRKLPGA